jgi:hypothetical protein
VIKGTKLDFYSVASPSPFVHRQITWMLTDCMTAVFPCEKRLGLAFKIAIKFPAGGSVPDTFISLGQLNYKITLLNHQTALIICSLLY